MTSGSRRALAIVGIATWVAVVLGLLAVYLVNPTWLTYGLVVGVPFATSWCVYRFRPDLSGKLALIACNTVFASLVCLAHPTPIAFLVGIALIVMLVVNLWQFARTNHKIPAADAFPGIPAETVEQTLLASPVTLRVAEKNARHHPGGIEVKWLLPDDLRKLYYDDRHHAGYLPTLFNEMFTRGGIKKHKTARRWRARAIRNFVIVSVGVAVIAMILVGWLGDVRGQDLVAAGLFGLALNVANVAIGLPYCLNHTRLVCTERITAELHDTWPWIPERRTYIFSATLTESTYDQGFWAKIMRFSHHQIETTEQNPMLTGWRYARHPHQLDYALNGVNRRPHTFPG